jgi:hypothetical protein
MLGETQSLGYAAFAFLDVLQTKVASVVQEP